MNEKPTGIYKEMSKEPKKGQSKQKTKNKENKGTSAHKSASKTH